MPGNCTQQHLPLVKVLLLDGHRPPQAIVFPVGGSLLIDQSAFFPKHIQYTAFPVLVKGVNSVTTRQFLLL